MAQAQMQSTGSDGKWVDERQTPEQIRSCVAQDPVAVVIIVGVDGSIKAYPMEGTYPYEGDVPDDARELSSDSVQIRVTTFNPKCTTTKIGGQSVTVCK